MTQVQDKASIVEINEIMRNIPHRYPFLLVDRVVNMVEGKSALGIKNVSINEPFFAGHFPSAPVMPGVLIIEAMAQTAGVLVCKSVLKNPQEKLVFFSSIEEVKFRKIVIPGDQLLLHVVIDRNRMDFWKFTGTATVNDQLVAQAKFTAKIIDKKDVANS